MKPTLPKFTTQLAQVQPSERGVLEVPVVEIEAVDVDVGNQSRYKDRDRL